MASIEMAERSLESSALVAHFSTAATSASMRIAGPKFQDSGVMAHGRVNLNMAKSCMRIWLFISVALMWAPSSIANSRSDEREILRLENALSAAWSKRDVAAAGALLADDFQYWSFKGARRNKADLLRTVAGSPSGDTKIEDPVVRVYGDTAIFTARIIDIVKSETGEALTTKTCVTDVFVRRHGKWLMVASHETLLPENS